MRWERRALLACVSLLLFHQVATKALESSAQVEGLTKEFGNLKTELQSRQSQLETTLKKVADVEAGEWNADGAKSILQDELKSAQKVLAAAEGKLDKVEGQLKSVLERALSAESSAGEAQADIKGLRDDHQKVTRELHEQLEAAKATQGSTEEMLARADKAEQLAKQLQEQLQSSEKTGTDKLAQLAGKLKDIESRSQKDLQAASKQVADFSSKLEAAGKQLEAAETKLKAAEKESADTKTNLEQMLSKAEEATVQVQQLLEKSLEKWLPNWMEKRYEKILSGIRPTLQQGWQATNQYTSGAQAQASDFYAKSRDYTSKTWSTYQPHVNRLSSDWKSGLLTRTSSMQKAAGPQLRAASQAVLRSTSSIRKQAEQALSGPQVLKARRHLRKYVITAQRELKKLRRDLERFFAGHMKRFPALVPYTKRPYISWITYALVVGPILLVVLPWLGGSGAKKSSSSNHGARGAASRAGDPPAKATPASSSLKANKKEKGRRLTEGADSIRIP